MVHPHAHLWMPLTSAKQSTSSAYGPAKRTKVLFQPHSIPQAFALNSFSTKSSGSQPACPKGQVLQVMAEKEGIQCKHFWDRMGLVKDCFAESYAELKPGSYPLFLDTQSWWNLLNMLPGITYD